MDQLNQVPQSSKKARRRTNAKPVHVPEQLRAIEQAKVQRLARDWVMGGHGHMQVPKPPGHFRISLENITSIGVSSTRDRVGGIPPKRPQNDDLSKQCNVDVQCTAKNQQNFDLIQSHLKYSKLFGKKKPPGQLPVVMFITRSSTSMVALA